MNQPSPIFRTEISSVLHPFGDCESCQEELNLVKGNLVTSALACFFALAQTVCVENLKVLGWLMMLSFSTHEQKQHFFGQVSRWDRATKLLWGFEV